MKGVMYTILDKSVERRLVHILKVSIVEEILVPQNAPKLDCLGKMSLYEKNRIIMNGLRFPVLDKIKL